MISGFNTDVEFGGITYHIQTEDKGLDTPVILSLVYDRGTILAAKRAPYDDLLEKGFDEQILNQRLTKQHKTICAAIKKGRINDLKSFTLQKRNGNAPVFSPSPALEVLEVLPSFEDTSQSGTLGPLSLETDSMPFASSDFDAFDEFVPPIPMPKAPAVISKKPGPLAEPVIEAVAVVDIPEPLPFDAVMVVSDLAGTERSESQKLSLQFIGEDAFLGGEKAYITVMVCRGGARVVEGAEVMVKVLGTSFRPLIFHSQTDKNGISTVGMQIPSFNTGRASILVRAINKGEEVEVRRPIIHG